MQRRDRIRRARRAGLKSVGTPESERKLRFLERCRKGGKARAASMTPEQRSEAARKAANARHHARQLERTVEETGEPPLDDDLVL